MDATIDGKLTVRKNGHAITLNAEIITYFRKHQIIPLLETKKRLGNLVIIADYIPPFIREALRSNGIGYLDSSGNMSIEEGDLLLLVEGKRKRKKEVPTAKAFTKSALKVVFVLLAQPDLVNSTYRTLSERSGASLDTISKTFKALEKGNYLLKLDKKERKLNQPQKLLERWATEYVEKLKPSLAMGKFRFLKKDQQQNWDQIALNIANTRWGGEPGADQLLNDLRPESLTLYTRESRRELMKNYGLLPDSSGPVQVYEMFWDWESKGNPKFVDPVLIYADLLESMDPRSIEMANNIYEQFIKSRY